MSTCLFRDNLKRILKFMEGVPNQLASAYVVSDRDDGKIYLTVDYTYDDLETEKYIKDWLIFNSSLVEGYFISYNEYEKRYSIKLR